MITPHLTENTKEAFTARHIRWTELALIGGILVLFLGRDIQSVDFHGDESHWIHTSYFLGPFVTADFSSPAWNVSYWTLTQPPVTRYIIGIGRRIGGLPAADLNIRGWNFSLSTKPNVARGTMPSPILLWWSRLPMAILAAVSGVLLFFLTTKAAGRMAGYVLLILFMLNPYLLTTLRRAMGDSPLLVFVLFAAVAGYHALISWQSADADDLSRTTRFRRTMIWFGIMGVFCGVAAGVKLNGILVVLAGLGLCIVFPFIRRQRAHGTYEATLCACVLVLSTGITFIALNPFLYPNPLHRTMMMAQQRVKEISEQQKAWPEASIDRSRRIPVVRQRVFEDYATVRFGSRPLRHRTLGAFERAGEEISIGFSPTQTFNLLLCIIGLAYLLYSSWGCLQRPMRSSAAIAVLLVAFTTATPSLFTPLDWDRYYLLPVVFSTVLVAVAIGGAARVVLGWTRRSADGALLERLGRLRF